MDSEKLEEHLKSMKAELDNFQEIAVHLKPLPGEIPVIPGIDIYGSTLPLKGPIGGDHIIYVDFNKRFDLDSKIENAVRVGQTHIAERLRRNKLKAGILLADVSGHRITDALLGSMLHQAFLLGVKYELKYNGFISVDLFETINTRFYNSSAVNKFITMIYGEISSEGNFRFLSAAHPLPLVFSNEYNRIVEISGDRFTTFPPIGTVPSKQERGMDEQASPLGYKERYTINEINLMGEGDIMLLYTDGFSEHENDNGELYTATRLENKLREIKTLSAEKIHSEIMNDLTSFSTPDDDLSLVVIKKA